jgi:hypothetical protein
MITQKRSSTYSQINVDAQACFDCIIPNIAIQVSRKYGVHHSILEVFKEVLENAKYFVKVGTQVTSHKSQVNSTKIQTRQNCTEQVKEVETPHSFGP